MENAIVNLFLEIFEVLIQEQFTQVCVEIWTLWPIIKNLFVWLVLAVRA